MVNSQEFQALRKRVARLEELITLMSYAPTPEELASVSKDPASSTTYISVWEYYRYDNEGRLSRDLVYDQQGKRKRPPVNAKDWRVVKPGRRLSTSRQVWVAVTARLSSNGELKLHARQLSPPLASGEDWNQSVMQVDANMKRRLEAADA